jgi:very-short-patch-repair endonuclease
MYFAKVRVADILQPQSGCDRSTWQRAFNKISAKHFDFVICKKEALELKCVIELDDSSHKRQDRANRDNFLNDAAQSAGLAIVHFPVKASYTAEQIQSKLSRVMG